MLDRLDLLPAERQAVLLERVRPVRRLRVVIDVVLPAADRPVNRPARWQRRLGGCKQTTIRQLTRSAYTCNQLMCLQCK